jgi:hypothetical protein
VALKMVDEFLKTFVFSSEHLSSTNIGPNIDIWLN